LSSLSLAAKAHALGGSTTVSHYSAWTGVSRPVDIIVSGFDGPVTIHRLPGGLSREDISLVIPVVCTILVLPFAWRRRWRLTEEDAVALLAISFLLRVTLDSTVLLYYFAPMVLALAWWEVRRRGIPLGTAAGSVFIWQLFRETHNLPETLSFVLFVCASAAICVCALPTLFAPTNRAEA
jgi:hypothetical protein